MGVGIGGRGKCASAGATRFIYAVYVQRDINLREGAAPPTTILPLHANNDRSSLYPNGEAARVIARSAKSRLPQHFVRFRPTAAAYS